MDPNLVQPHPCHIPVTFIDFPVRRRVREVLLQRALESVEREQERDVVKSMEEAERARRLDEARMAQLESSEEQARSRRDAEAGVEAERKRQIAVYQMTQADIQGAKERLYRCPTLLTLSPLIHFSHRDLRVEPHQISGAKSLPPLCMERLMRSRQLRASPRAMRFWKLCLVKAIWSLTA